MIIFAVSKEKVANKIIGYDIPVCMFGEILCFMHIIGCTITENCNRRILVTAVLVITVIIFYMIIVLRCFLRKKQMKEIENYVNNKLNIGNEEIIDFLKQQEEYYKEQIILINCELQRAYENIDTNKYKECVGNVIEDRKNKAKNKRIGISADFIIKEKSEIDIKDMMSILSNLMDNAIEGSENNSEEKRIISLWGEMDNNILRLEISNPYEKKLNLCNGEIITTKSDKKKHGLGLKIIKEIAEKYNLIMNISIDENIFKVSLESKN